MSKPLRRKKSPVGVLSYQERQMKQLKKVIRQWESSEEEYHMKGKLTFIALIARVRPLINLITRGFPLPKKFFKGILHQEEDHIDVVH